MVASVDLRGVAVRLKCTLTQGPSPQPRLPQSPEPWTGGILTLPLLPPQRRFPDFSYITRSGRLTDFLDCVIIR